MTKHLVFAWQPLGRVLSNSLWIWALDHDTAFAVLQSRIHEAWTRLLSSSMRSDLRYIPSECFETFPFPRSEPRSIITELEEIGRRLSEARADYMVETQQGLTQTYNRLKDPACTDAPIVALRQLHEEMDQAVLTAYGWQDLQVPPFCPTTPAEENALALFQDHVIDHLFVLNAQRATDEARDEPQRRARPSPTPTRTTTAKGQGKLF